MDKPLDIGQFTNADPESEVLRLKEHIASGAEDRWAVYTQTHTSSEQSWQFGTYQEANAKFDSLPADVHPTLFLYTRIGTVVQFRYKKPADEE